LALKRVVEPGRLQINYRATMATDIENFDELLARGKKRAAEMESAARKEGLLVCVNF